ncbi:DUF3083 family protein [Colwellia piezophila]|uniref:DUF3083 family protein n=1 Tax=Colwellia piezophila TaxID=211668 RepID=UPI00037768A4|nr:DUF3083 family protein [Colwellia piezophila]
MPISRTKNLQHKAYIPSSARENQYLMAKIPLTDALITQFQYLIYKNKENPFEKLYQYFADTFFAINDKYALESTQFIANDKFARVRFSPEKFTAQTKQQVLFLYNPKYHTSRNSFFNGANRAKKITLIFLANGEDIRGQSAQFHRLVTKALTDFAQETNIALSQIRVSDHQHLTYDLFAKNKGIEGSQAHKFRAIADRYLADNLVLPEQARSLTYAVVDFPINARIRGLVDLDENIQKRYNPLYSLIADAFIGAAKNQNLNNGAVIANGLVPIIRSAEDENVVTAGELLMLGYNPQHTSCGYTCKWNSAKLVDSIQLIFVASDQDKTSHGYGKFVNNVEQALRVFSQKLDIVTEKEEIMVRLHQHIGFHLA